MRRRSTLGRDDSAQLGSTRLRDSDASNPNSLNSGSDSVALCSAPALNSTTAALLTPEGALCRRGGKEEKRENGKVSDISDLDPELEGLGLLL